MRVLSEINGRIGRLEGAQEAQAKAIGDMAASVNRLVDKLDRSDDIAREADHRARTAHHRIDDTRKEIGQTKDDIRWLWRTVIGAIITGALGGAAVLLWKVIGG